jgi:hypothetical protein
MNSPETPHRNLLHPEIEPWPSSVDGSLLLADLAKTLRRFVVLPPHAAEALALWVLHTYAFQLRAVSAYLGIESPEKRCGKTTLLSVLSQLVNRPIVASNISPSAFFRVIEETRPTLLIDEADTLLQGNDELRGILNSGHTPSTAFVLRVAPAPSSSSSFSSSSSSDDQDGSHLMLPREIKNQKSKIKNSQLARYSTWCPKALAAIGHLPETLADRCILIRMQRKTPGESCERLRNLDATDLRRQCLRFVLDNADKIAAARPEIPSSLHDRAADLWEPLLALADLAGEWSRFARDSATALSASTADHSPIGALLLDIMFLFATHQQHRLFSRTLVAGLNDLPARPWSSARQGKQATEIWLANQLRPFGIRPRTMWVGPQLAKGYLAEDFEEACRRYVSRHEFEALRADLAPPAPAKPAPERSSPQASQTLTA